ncbi:MAG: hypothetical protein WCG79_02205 [Verrucomicrobiota bacterium]
MKAGNSEFIIWLIVAVVVMVAKGLGKLATPPEQAAPTTPSRPPQPKPVVRRPTTRRPIVTEVTPPIIPSTRVTAEEKPTTQPPVATAQPAQPSRPNQWATALRDRQNIRNVIIANEIIGRPVSLREL